MCLRRGSVNVSVCLCVCVFACACECVGIDNLNDNHDKHCFVGVCVSLRFVFGLEYVCVSVYATI